MHGTVDIPYLPILKFLVLSLIFLLPGYGIVYWLHRREGFAWYLRWTLSFAWSAAVFGLVAFPSLWFGGNFRTFSTALCATWSAYAVVGALGYLCARPAGPTDFASMSDTSVANDAITTRESQRATRLTGCLILAVSLVLALVPAYNWVRAQQQRLTIIYLAPVILLAGFLLAWFFRRVSGPLLEFDADDDRAPPWIWTAIAVGFILFQAITATIYLRHSRDDGYYFAAVLDFQEAPFFNDQEPSHREGMPVATIHRTLCWELWGAAMCHWTGLTPMGLFRTLLPGPLILMAYAAYTALLSIFMPRRWLPIALIGLSAVHLWGMSNNETAINFLLPRPWQSKTILIHIGVPVLAFLFIRFLTRPSFRMWLSLLACVLFGLTVCLSAVFMFAIQIAALVLALIPYVRRRPLATVSGTLGALAPLVLVGILIWMSLEDYSSAAETYPHLRSWYSRITFYLRFGTAEVVWVFTLPLLAAILVDNWRKPYLTWFPIAMGLTFANPFLYTPVCLYLTSYYTYDRMWWLLPVGPGLGVLLALIVRYVSRCLRQSPGVGFPLVITALGLAVAWGMPGVYVWSPKNQVWGIMQTPHVADNFQKMPTGLIPLADILVQDPVIRETRILCNEPIATYLTSYSRNFRFVQTRPEYTEVMLTILGRPEDGKRRRELAKALGRNVSGPGALEFRRDLQEFKVKYVITGPGDRANNLLLANGYQVLRRQGDFALWKIQPTRVQAYR